MKKTALLLVFVLLLTGTTVFAAVATHKNPDEKAEYIFESTSLITPCQLEKGKDIAQYMNVDKAFSQIQLDCPSWSNNIGSMTMKLYNWKGDYAATVTSEPIATETFVNYEDNSWLTLKANGSFPAGEYMWLLTDPVETVGIWKAKFDNLKCAVVTTSYLAGEKIKGTYNSCIVYADNASANEYVTDTENVIMYVDSLKTYVKGVEKYIDVPATVIDGRTLVPVRFVSESFGAEVSYVEETQTVVVEKGEIVIALVIGNNEMRINGETKILDVAATTISDRTVVPLRAIAEALGEQVNYFADGDKGLIVVGPSAALFDADKAEGFIKKYK